MTAQTFDEAPAGGKSAFAADEAFEPGGFVVQGQ
jgi:hypothetical protein